MAKKLSDIEEQVNNSQEAFLNYLEKNLNAEAYKSLKNLGSKCSVYIFSGIIRNFFLNVTEELRDLDVVVECDCDVYDTFQKYYIKRNSFGGYKIDIKGTNIDLWCIKDTWMYQFQKTLDFSLFQGIPNTAFFNFSSILYDFSNSTFIYKTDFLRFLRDKELEVVNEINPNYTLCIVNSFYYSDKYKLTIGNNLKHLIIDKHVNVKDYSCVQMKHFGKVVYTNQEIENRIKDIWLDY